MKRIFLFLGLSLSYSISYGLNTLPQAILDQASKLQISPDGFSVVIQEVNSKKATVTHLAHMARTPASVMKVLTTYAALLKLGENYRWPTQFYSNGKVRNGTLHGDLVVKAYGNPDLLTEDLEPIVNGLKSRGIQHITGNLIVDQSYFKNNQKNWSKFDKNTYSPYNAMPAALMFNHRANKINIKGSRKKNKVYVTKTFPDRSYQISNNLKVSNVPCRGKHAWPDEDISNNGKSGHVKMYGLYSSRCPDREIYKVLTSSANTFYAALRQTLKQKNGSLKGGLRFSAVPQNSKKIYTHFSKPLIEVIKTINKKSNNVMARQTLLTLGAKLSNMPATKENGAKAIKEILNQYQLLEKNTRISNGSGLSRTAKLSAQTLSDILIHGYHNPAPWMHTLSIMGVDGTLKRRLRNTIVEGRAWMKTGSLNHVRSIAGYVRAASGKTYTTVVLINHPRSGGPGRKLQDFIVKWVAENH